MKKTFLLSACFYFSVLSSISNAANQEDPIGVLEKAESRSGARFDNINRISYKEVCSKIDELQDKVSDDIFDNCVFNDIDEYLDLAEELVKDKKYIDAEYVACQIVDQIEAFQNTNDISERLINLGFKYIARAVNYKAFDSVGAQSNGRR